MLTALLLALAADFRAIELHNGGEVIVRYAPVQEIRFAQGDARRSRISAAGGRLVIDHCPDRCPRGYRMVVEVATPAVDSLSVSDGGSIRVEGGFPAQAAIAARVSSGGVIDIRALRSAEVSAAVAQGGLIFARPGRRLDARVEQGGAITYWGRPAVLHSVRHGGVVQRGAEGDRDRPLSELGPRPVPVPRVPPLPGGFLNRR